MKTFQKSSHSIEIGFGFGVTSGVITTLGLMIGLNAGTHSRLAVIGGILTIAIADAFSDAFGIHMSEESESVHTEKEIWTTTLFTFLFKFIFGATFLVPVLLFELDTAVMASIAWGLFLLSIFSFYVARKEGINPIHVVGEHLLIAILVIYITNFVGSWIAATFV